MGGKKVGEGVFDWYVDPGIGLTGLTKGVGWWTWARETKGWAWDSVWIGLGGLVYKNKEVRLVLLSVKSQGSKL